MAKPEDMALIENIDSLISKLSFEKRMLCLPDDRPWKSLWDTYLEMYADWAAPENERVFLFCYLCLYDPLALLGERMRKSTRKELAKAMGFKTCNIVSMRAKDALFRYRSFPQFRKSADSLIDAFFNKSCQKT